jgi:hypothetical protein
MSDSLICETEKNIVKQQVTTHSVPKHMWNLIRLYFEESNFNTLFLLIGIVHLTLKSINVDGFTTKCILMFLNEKEDNWFVLFPNSCLTYRVAKLPNIVFVRKLVLFDFCLHLASIIPQRLDTEK